MADDETHVVAPDAFLNDPNVRFPRKPQLVTDLGIYRTPEGIGIQFRGGPIAVAFRGIGAEQTFDYLLQALDGTRDVHALVAGCPRAVPRERLLRTLCLLHTKGLLCDGAAAAARRVQPADVAADETVSRQLLFWGRHLGLTGYLQAPEDAQDRIATSRIAIVATGLFGLVTWDLLARSGCKDLSLVAWDDSGFLIESIRASLAPPRAAIHLATTAVDALTTVLRDWARDVDLVVTATRNAPAALLHEVNRICLDRHCAALFGNDNGNEFELGPYVLPYASACYGCVQLRKASAHDNMLEEQVYQRQMAVPREAGRTAPVGESLASAAVAASLLSLETVRILTRTALPTLLNTVQTLSPLAGELESHRILRVPRCPECSRGSTLPVAHEQQFASA